jgi:ABC-type antimicrobial peptide transport system permease subunit
VKIELTPVRLLAKSLHGRRIRTALAIAGIATCTLLVIVIASALRSVRNAMADYVGQEGIDLWVGPQGADNLIRGSFVSFVPLRCVDSIRAIPGVSAADPILEAFLPVQPLGQTDPQKRLTLIAIGYRLPGGLGGAPLHSAGRPPKRPNEVVLDRAAAHRLMVGIGDTIEVSGRRVTITGLARGTNILATQFVFGSYEAMALGSNAIGWASYVLVRLTPTADRVQVIHIIETRFPGLRAYTREYFLASNDREVSAGFAPVLVLMAFLGMGAAMVLIGLLILSVVDERRADIAVLMALGTGSTTIARGVLAHAAGLSLKGALIGIALAYALQGTLDSTTPTIPLSIAVSDVAVIAFLFIVTGLVAAAVPVVRLSTIDPLEAFRS